MSKKRLRSEILRLEIAKRAKNCCEYCRVHEDDMFIGFEIDHIIAHKHGGGNEVENLAYACPHCNQHKGSDLVTFIDSYDDIVSAKGNYVSRLEKTLNFKTKNVPTQLNFYC